MSWKASELERLLAHDVDDVVNRARSLDGKDRTSALRDSVAKLTAGAEPITRLKTLLFIQTLLASFPDGKLASSVADPAANELARVVTSTLEPEELKRPALDGLALLFLKARELTTSADARVRDAFTAARNSADPQLRDFAKNAFLTNGVLAQRVVQRQYRYVMVSIKAAGTLSAVAGGYMLAKARKKQIASSKRKQSSSVRGTSPSRAHKLP